MSKVGSGTSASFQWQHWHQRFVFQDYVNGVEFLISLGHLSPHVGTAWWACHDNNNNTTHYISTDTDQVSVTQLDKLFKFLRRQQVSLADSCAQLTKHCQQTNHTYTSPHFEQLRRNWITNWRNAAAKARVDMTYTLCLLARWRHFSAWNERRGRHL